MDKTMRSEIAKTILEKKENLNILFELNSSLEFIKNSIIQKATNQIIELLNEKQLKNDLRANIVERDGLKYLKQEGFSINLKNLTLWFRFDNKDFKGFYFDISKNGNSQRVLEIETRGFVKDKYNDSYWFNFGGLYTNWLENESLIGINSGDFKKVFTEKLEIILEAIKKI